LALGSVWWVLPHRAGGIAPELAPEVAAHKPEIAPGFRAVANGRGNLRADCGGALRTLGWRTLSSRHAVPYSFNTKSAAQRIRIHKDERYKRASGV